MIRDNSHQHTVLISHDTPSNPVRQNPSRGCVVSVAQRERKKKERKEKKKQQQHVHIGYSLRSVWQLFIF
jgi:hypothetical protein